MSSGQPIEAPIRTLAIPRLEPGDHLDQKTYHERYVAMSEDVKAELIGGVVYMPAALSRDHGRPHSLINAWLVRYEMHTPGVECCDNATTILGEKSEPQPDAILIVQSDKGGQSRWNEHGFLEGPRELAIEIALSSDSCDLHAKKQDYEIAGVKEYMVLAIRHRIVYWFSLKGGQFVDLSGDSHGIFRSQVFPGLWLDSQALIQHDGRRLMETLDMGLATQEHESFAARLR